MPVNKTSSKAPPGRVRIIGGKWRGRKLPIMSYPELRPTPDRVRETLFNWLQPVIEGAVCLDLFAGTGVLGFEALSRGARRVVMVEQDSKFAGRLEQQRKHLETDDVEIIHAEALEWLKRTSESFDLVFLDPPFRKNLIPPSCEMLLNRRHLHPHSRVYIESEPGVCGSVVLTNKFRIFRQSHAGQVEYSLLECGQQAE
ncbi:MAG: 16S rRNA (guanine(966)-N(2))-methyltransferase RsmD [Gammaproteobacteria bacterium RIFCSPLOWO2_02_FULL_56_15]|nr:MAG: 16S rRNA (guanine(966)-N(2))-methyltransferase RsmD [Gammaproteobacteria bacterium RIFCSPLOWO2_02_FULL_56_15]